MLDAQKSEKEKDGHETEHARSDDGNSIGDLDRGNGRGPMMEVRRYFGPDSPSVWLMAAGDSWKCRIKANERHGCQARVS